MLSVQEVRVVPGWAGPSRSHVANQVDVVVQVAHKVVGDVVRRAARVADELALGHLVLDMRAAEVDGEQDEAVAQHVDGICGVAGGGRRIR